MEENNVIKQAEQPNKNKRTKKPIRNFPTKTVEEAAQIALKIKQLNGGNEWVSEEVAKSVGKSKANTDFYYLTAASRDYGLTSGTRDTKTISLTPLGRDLAYASSPDIEEEIKVKAFFKVEIFKGVYEYYKGEELPEGKYLNNVLENNFKLPTDFHEEFADVYTKNYKSLHFSAHSQQGKPKSHKSQSSTPTEPKSSTTKTDALKLFVAMPFSEKVEGREKGFFHEVLNTLLKPAGEEAGFHVYTANKGGSDIIQSTIVNDILSADLVLADLTDHNPNVLFELGLRIAIDKPVVIVKAEGTDKVFDVDSMMRYYEYSPKLWKSTIEKDLPKLAEHIKSAWENKDSSSSYMKILTSRIQ